MPFPCYTSRVSVGQIGLPFRVKSSSDLFAQCPMHKKGPSVGHRPPINLVYTLGFQRKKLRVHRISTKSSKLVYGPMFLLIFICQRVLIAFLSDAAYRSLFPHLSLFLPFFLLLTCIPFCT